MIAHLSPDEARQLLAHLVRYPLPPLDTFCREVERKLAPKPPTVEQLLTAAAEARRVRFVRLSSVGNAHIAEWHRKGHKVLRGARDGGFYLEWSAHPNSRHVYSESRPWPTRAEAADPAWIERTFSALLATMQLPEAR